MLDVIPTPQELKTIDLKGHIVIVIDVLRATSCMTLAFASGVKSIIPCGDRNEALSLRTHYPLALLAGEEKGDKMPGFDLGNSPMEYSGPSVRDKVIIMTTSNGTKAIKAAVEKGARNILIASFLNLKAVSNTVRKAMASTALNAPEGPFILRENPITVICSGSHGQFSSEDFACAGAIVKMLLPGPIQLSERAQEASRYFSARENDIYRILIESPHGRYLQSKGYGDDLVICARLNSVQAVPFVKDTKVVPYFIVS